MTVTNEVVFRLRGGFIVPSAPVSVSLDRTRAPRHPSKYNQAIRATPSRMCPKRVLNIFLTPGALAESNHRRREPRQMGIDLRRYPQQLVVSPVTSDDLQPEGDAGCRADAERH